MPSKKMVWIRMAFAKIGLFLTVELSTPRAEQHRGPPGASPCAVMILLQF